MATLTSHKHEEQKRAKFFLDKWPRAQTANEMPEFVICQHCGSKTQHFECDCCFEPVFPVVSELQKEIPEEDEDPESLEALRSQASRLMRVHRNLGHPSNRLLVQILTEAKAPKKGNRNGKGPSDALYVKG